MWILERVEADEMWTLFDPFEVTELTSLYGEDFEKRYVELENSEDEITRERVSAKGLWKEMLRSYFETGNPFLTFKDTANRANPNKHVGVSDLQTFVQRSSKIQDLIHTKHSLPLKMVLSKLMMNMKC
jgi:ribonucleotide reductase alpha subunit